MIFRELMEHLKREKEIDRRKTACKNVATGMAVGTLLGLTAGILFAPKSGKETRKDIADKTTQTAEQVKEAMSCYVEELKDKALVAEQNAREMAKSLKSKLQEATSKVRQEVGEELEEVAEEVKPE